MKIAVVGAGGVGGYFGGRLALAGEQVSFVARGEHLRAICDKGLRIESVLGDFEVRPAHATAEPAEIGPVDVVLVAVKAWQVAALGPSLRPLLGEKTFVVPLQNGVEAPAQLAAVLGTERVLGGLCRIISFVAGPGVVRHVGAEPTVTFGELDRTGTRDGNRSERAERLRAAFLRAGLSAEVPDDVEAAMWEKFLFITSFGGIGAIMRTPVGAWRTLPGPRAMLESAMHEVLAVARARGVALDEGSVARAVAYIDALPREGIASMARDIMAGRPSELEAWNGAVVRLGAEVSVPTPTHTFIYHTLLPLELKARGAISS